jgi:oligopeptide transport system substrate-binding protein
MAAQPRRVFLRSALAALVAGRAAAQSGAPSGAPSAAQSGAPPGAPSAGAATASTGILRRVVSTEITSLDPQRPTGQVTTDIGAELFCGLTYYDRDGRVAPGCAQSWQASPDGLTWTFRLREGLRWSDGRPLTARDFVFTLRRYLSPETAVAQAGRLEAIRGAHELRLGRGKAEALGVSAPDARTVRIELEYPDVELPTLLSSAYCVPEHVITPRGRDWLRPEFLVSNGAYALEQWAPGAKVIRLRRNPHFHDAARVAIPRVDWLTGYDDGTRLSLFRLGEVEDATIEDAGNLGAARRDLAASLRSSPEASVGWLGFNVTRGRMADPRLRMALSLAIDRRLITDKVRGLGEQPSDALLPPGLPGHGAPPLPPYADWPMPRRLATARELLRQAGIAPGSLPPLLLGYSASPTLRKVFLAIASMWKAIGIRADIQPLDGRAYGAALTESRFDAFSYAAFAQVPTAVVFLDRFVSGSPANVTFWRSAEFDRLFQAALRQREVAARAAGMIAAERVALRELPVAPLWIGVSNRLVSPRVAGWVDHPGHAHPSQYLALRGA